MKKRTRTKDKLPIDLNRVGQDGKSQKTGAKSYAPEPKADRNNEWDQAV